MLAAGPAGLRVRWRGGRPAKLTATQRQRLAEIVTAGPAAAGFATGCWHALLIQQVIEREFGVLYNVHYLAHLLHTLGFSFQKARFVADHLDAVRRATWLAYTWPGWRAQAAAAGGLLLFGDEASFAQWGSLGYTWAPIGQQPVVQTTGRRKAYKVFGLIEFFSGRLFYQGLDGKLNGQSYIAFLTGVLAQTTEPLFLVQDGAPYHRAAPVKSFFEQHRARLHVTHLPSYSPTTTRSSSSGARPSVPRRTIATSPPSTTCWLRSSTRWPRSVSTPSGSRRCSACISTISPG